MSGLDNLKAELSIIHDCQDILEANLKRARVEIEEKLAGFPNGAAMFLEFDLTLRDYMTDCLGDTLDHWAGGIVADIEYRCHFDGLRPPEQYDAPRVL